jgi:hypothetical protein
MHENARQTLESVITAVEGRQVPDQARRSAETPWPRPPRSLYSDEAGQPIRPRALDSAPRSHSVPVEPDGIEPSTSCLRSVREADLEGSVDARGRSGFGVPARLGIARSLPWTPGECRELRHGCLKPSTRRGDRTTLDLKLPRLGSVSFRPWWQARAQSRDCEGCLHAGGGRPTDAYAALCGQLKVDWPGLKQRPSSSKRPAHHTFSLRAPVPVTRP